jgi:hypothetical protein
VAEPITLSQFKVYMGEFHEAIGVVSTQCKIVHETLSEIEHDLNAVTQLWQSPAANTFDPVRAEFKKSSDDLGDVLNGILHRMRITYQNYLEAERKAVQNLTAHQPDSGAGGQHGNGGGATHTGGGTSHVHHDGNAAGQPDTALREARAALDRREAASPPTGQSTMILPAGRELIPPRVGHR